ncbi:acyl-CoA dehydrogenase [Amycolatopsis sp. K13G38]|uniref:Acyl-CoA dehydrogenase n=1 Tax=Amycolatopsis acididurans TaxID=2724524 RepID=A0ABX1JI29_9PSEU|nr:acyl-CoA dehydrogenase family protein [Amycolatopsis acididurans]NKQ58060.1 acyl-CoA dehydrogenase [Amycolatopsis acididurans]
MKTMEEFRAEALTLLRQHLPPRHDAGCSAWGAGSDDVSIFPEHSLEEELAGLKRAQEWQAAKFDNGFGWITGPVEYGGAGLPQEYAREFDELEEGFLHPEKVFFSIGHGMVGPTLLREGIPETKDRYLRAIYRGDVICCQLFSEPEAGSDLASLRTTAVRADGDWVVNGQKMWTSGAHYSHFGLLLARTNPDARTHSGITMFLLPMDTAGVEARPLRQMTGGAHFNEVFLDDVRIPDSMRLGPVDEGWRVAMDTLANERASMRPGGSNATFGVVSHERVVELVRHLGLADDPVVRQEVAQLYTTRRVFEFNAQRLLGSDHPAGPGICKLLNTFIARGTAELVSNVLGDRIVADSGEWGTYAWAAYVLGVPAMRLGGGTDEIQRNILAERVLGLPRERI